MLGYTVFCNGLFGCTCMHGVTQREVMWCVCTVHCQKGSFCFSTSLCCAVEVDVGWRNRVSALPGRACRIVARPSSCEAVLL